MRSFAWAFGGVLACLSGAVAGVLFGSQFLGTNFQSAELAPISNALKATYAKAVAASRSIGRKLDTSRSGSERVAKRVAHAGTVGPVSLSGRTLSETKTLPPLLTTYQIQSQPVRIVRQDDVARHRPAQALVTGLTPPDVRAAVARDIERELRRAGCRIARTDGAWDRSSRAAMQRFLGNVNATLPTQNPDIILLTLVRGYHGKACGAGCGRNAKDRCSPPLEAERSRHVNAPQHATTDSPSQTEPDVGHTKGDPAHVRWIAVPQQTRQKSATAKKAVVPPAQSPAATPQTANRDTSKPGRMALGVPRPQPVKRLSKEGAQVPVPVNPAAALPNNLPAPYAPGAPRLVPDQKPGSAVTTLPTHPVAPAIRRPRGNASWRTRAFQVEN